MPEEGKTVVVNGYNDRCEIVQKRRRTGSARFIIQCTGWCIAAVEDRLMLSRVSVAQSVTYGVIT